MTENVYKIKTFLIIQTHNKDNKGKVLRQLKKVII